MGFHSKSVTPGATTAQPLSATSLPMSWGNIQNPIGNAGPMRIFASDMKSPPYVAGDAAPTGGGVILQVGGTLLLPQLMCPNSYDWANIFVAVTNAADKVDLAWGYQ